jgi:hypothetical protein
VCRRRRVGGLRPYSPQPRRCAHGSWSLAWWTQEGVAVVDRSTTGSNSSDPGGQSADAVATHATGLDTVDELNHLAKVRVAGSNPVFRSIKVPGQSGFVKLLAAMTHPNRDGAIAKVSVEGSSVRVVSREPLSDCLAGAPRFRRVPQFRRWAYLFDSVACAWDAIDRRDSRPSDR